MDLTFQVPNLATDIN